MQNCNEAVRTRKLRQTGRRSRGQRWWRCQECVKEDGRHKLSPWRTGSDCRRAFLFALFIAPKLPRMRLQPYNPPAKSSTGMFGSAKRPRMRLELYNLRAKSSSILLDCAKFLSLWLRPYIPPAKSINPSSNPSSYEQWLFRFGKVSKTEVPTLRPSSKESLQFDSVQFGKTILTT